MSTPRPPRPQWWSTPNGPGGPEMRIGDAEREAAVSALGEHYAAGRLTKDEYDERAEQAWSARTASALRPLFADLPGPHSGTPAARAATGPATSRGTTRTRQPFRLPFLPVLLVVIGLAMLLEAPWMIFVVLGLLWLSRSRRHGCHGPTYRR